MDSTLLKGLRVLEAVTDTTNPPRSIDDLAVRVGLRRSNAHRTLQTLIFAGYIVRDKTSGSYRATPRLFELGARQLGQMDVRSAAASFLQSLANATGEAAHLSVLDGLDVICIDAIGSPGPIRTYPMIGRRAPAHAVACGKVLLANRPNDYVGRHLQTSLQRSTYVTVVRLSRLEDELSEILRQGYSVDCGGWHENVASLAAAIFDDLDQPVAAVGIAGPLDRLVGSNIGKLAEDVVACARSISRAIGHNPA